MKKALFAITLIIIALAIMIGRLMMRPAIQAPVTDDQSVQPAPTATVQPIETDHFRLNGITYDQTVSSPLTLTGAAKGWYFEASFPVQVLDANGAVLAQVPAQAQSDWMTADWVPFSVTINFVKPSTATGKLIFKNDNPSGDPARDERVEVPVKF